jgi:hypothetical protein
MTARRSTPMVPAAQGRSHRWHTSVNHHLAHDTMVALLDGAEREHASLGPAPSHRSSRLPLGAACRPGGRRRRPSQAWPKLLGHDLDSRLCGAVPSSPAPLLELAHDHDPAALDEDSAARSAWSRHTITVKNDASCSRGPLTVTRNMALD